MFGKTLTDDKDFLQAGLQQPYLIIENALLPEFAEQLYQELMTTDAWVHDDKTTFTEKELALTPDEYSFTREIINLDSGQLNGQLPDSVNKLFKYLKSDECLQWITKASGRKCDDFSGACARYFGGNHLTRHNDLYMRKKPDGAVTTRVVTFNYYLTKNWRSDWGGNFVWENPAAKLTPTFNTLVLFPVGHDSMHFVEEVSKDASSPRLAFTGWFTVTRQPGYRKLNLSRD
jgi:Rps23 Pro-64 3,4-dihydroxylase Tpa1-like proline 4-hydroxylase